MKRTDYFNLLITTAACGVGLLSSNPLLVTIVGGIGINWASDLVGKGREQLGQQLFQEQAILNGDIARAFAKAIVRALDPTSLLEEYRNSPAFVRLLREDPTAANTSTVALAAFVDDVERFGAAPIPAPRHALHGQRMNPLTLWQGGSEQTATAIAQSLADYFHGHHEAVIHFVRQRLDQARIALFFANELKQTTPEGTAAFRAFQMLLIKSLQDSLATIQQDAAQVRQVERQLSDFQETSRHANQALTALVQRLSQQVTSEADRVITTLGKQVDSLGERFTQLERTLDADISSYQRAARRGAQLNPSRPMRVVNMRPQDVTVAFRNRVNARRTLRRSIYDDDVRFVCIVGRGGMGKTALVSHVLAQIESGSEATITEHAAANPIHGIVYLSPRTTSITLERIFIDVAQLLPEHQAETLLQKWRRDGITIKEKIEYLYAHLSTAAYIIVLDNLEDLVHPNGFLKDSHLRHFLHAGLTLPHRVTIVATSRQRVQIDGAGLRVARYIYLDDGLPQPEAVALLRDLDPQGELGLREADEQLLAKAVAVTHGIPRALEILAGQLYHDQLASLATLLQSEGKTKQKITAALVAESYHRLSDTERQIMQALSVFDRPVPIVAVRFLLLPWLPDLDATAVVQRLYARYHLKITRGSGVITLHPLDQEFAYAQIPAAADAAEPGAATYCRETLERRAAAFYRRMALPLEQQQTLRDLGPQMREFGHLVNARAYDDAYRMTEPFAFKKLMSWSYYQHMINMWERLRGRIVDPYLNTAYLGHLSIFYRAVGEFEEAIALNAEALDLARALSDQRWIAAWLHNQGINMRKVGRYQEAELLILDGLDLAQREGNDRSASAALLSLATLYLETERYEDALAELERAYRHTENPEKGEGADFLQLRFGEACFGLGRYQEAHIYFQRVIALNRAHTRYRARLMAGITLMTSGQLERAHVAFAACAEDCRKIVRRTPNSYRVQFAQAHALLGMHVLTNTNQSPVRELPDQVRTAYEQARLLAADSATLNEALRKAALIAAKPQLLGQIRQVLLR